jgi:signal peptidase II
MVFLLTGALVVVLDVLTKRLVATTFHPHEVRQVVGDYIRLTYIHNPGAAFGLFPGSRWPLIAISIAAVIVVAYVAWNRRHNWSAILPLGLILGGAVGNLIDRVRMGEVVDFVQVGIPPNYWPVFNVADSAVSVGVVWLALGMMRSGRQEVPEDGSAVTAKEDPVAGVAPSGDST